MESAGIHLEGLAYVICNKYSCSDCLETFFLSIFFYSLPIIFKRAYMYYNLSSTCTAFLRRMSHNWENSKVFQLSGKKKLFRFPNFFFFLIFSWHLLIPTFWSALLSWCWKCTQIFVCIKDRLAWKAMKCAKNMIKIWFQTTKNLSAHKSCFWELDPPFPPSWTTSSWAKLAGFCF